MYINRSILEEVTAGGGGVKFHHEGKLSNHTFAPQVVLCFSPVGSTLRVRSRKFPAIVNCTNIDWFHEWPEEALISVSTRFLSEVELITVSHSVLREPCYTTYFFFVFHLHTTTLLTYHTHTHTHTQTQMPNS